MSVYTKIIGLVLIGLFFTVSSFSEEMENPDTDIVCGIEVSGLKRTRNEYVQNLLKDFIGMPVNAVNIREIETRLQAAGLFSDIAVEIYKDQFDQSKLYITLDEKWSFIPIPFLAYTEEEFTGGFYIMDANAFGINDKIIFGGALSESGFNVLFVFSHRSLKYDTLGFFAYTRVMNGEERIKKADNHTITEYDAAGFDIGFSFLKNFAEWNTTKFELACSFRNIDDSPVDSVNLIRTGISTESGIRDWNSWFMSKTSAELAAACSFYNSGEWEKSVSFKGQLQKTFIERILVFSNITGYYANNSPAALYKNPSEAGISILPREFRYEKILGAVGGFELGILKTRIGIFSIYAKYEAVLSYDFNTDTVFCHGPSFGTKIYLSKIVFPALSIGVSRNVTTGNWLASIIFGFSY